MIYRWVVRKQAAAGWQRLSEQRFDETPLADDMHFVFLGMATRYHTEQDGRLVYRGVYFGRVVWGKVVEEIILPDTQALSAALAKPEQSETD